MLKSNGSKFVRGCLLDCVIATQLVFEANYYWHFN